MTQAERGKVAVRKDQYADRQQEQRDDLGARTKSDSQRTTMLWSLGGREGDGDRIGKEAGTWI